MPRKLAAGGHKRAPSATTQRFLPLDYRYRALRGKGRRKGEVSEGRIGYEEREEGKRAAKIINRRQGGRK